MLEIYSPCENRKLDNIPDDYFSIGSTHPMNGVSYVNEKLHQAFHHYIKVVSTNVEFASNKNSFQVYQMVQSAQIMQVQHSSYFITSPPACLACD